MSSISPLPIPEILTEYNKVTSKIKIKVPSKKVSLPAFLDMPPEKYWLSLSANEEQYYILGDCDGSFSYIYTNYLSQRLALTKDINCFMDVRNFYIKQCDAYIRVKDLSMVDKIISKRIRVDKIYQNMHQYDINQFSK